MKQPTIYWATCRGRISYLRYYLSKNQGNIRTVMRYCKMLKHHKRAKEFAEKYKHLFDD
jgi:hypothetical protein